ncbi:MAG: UDP-N-acetylglucosamine 1-carboxyvinyltransferase [Patescibacteria group bacterium]
MQEKTSDRFVVNGLGGKKTLSGKIRVNGAKNAALKLMAASVLFNDSVKLKNVPSIEDVYRMRDLLRASGAEADELKKGEYRIKTGGMKKDGELDHEISKRLRASIVATGPMLSRFGRVSFPHPGGCVIGARPIDLFIEGFEKMGASVRVSKKGTKDWYRISAKAGKLRGARIFFKQQSVTATETFMMAAVLAKGKTVLKNAALEPEIKHLADFLSKGGAKIKGAGTTTIEIKGGSLLQMRGRSFKIMPDRIETGSFLILGALAGKNIEIVDCNPVNVESLIQLLELSGVKIKTGKTNIIIKGNGVKNKNLKSVSVKTHEYPGFPTDLQAPMVVYLTQVKGESLVFETIFEGRLNYTESLARMGATTETWDPHRIMVKGPTELSGRVLESPDLRAGLAFVIAAIVAKGESVVHNVYNIDRGYEKIEERLKKIGVDIVRVKN